jgi:hypothetical protein
MSLVYLASYKGTRPGLHGLFNRAIRYRSRSIYSHSEVCIGDPLKGAVLCVSASGVDGGVRGKVMQLSPDKWDVVALPWVHEQCVMDVLRDEDGCGYDYCGVARFAAPWLPDLLLMPSDSAWFCSELAAHIMGLSEPWRYAPAELHAIATAALRWRD